jgi:hypothetical protein
LFLAANHFEKFLYFRWEFFFPSIAESIKTKKERHSFPLVPIFYI